MTFDFCLTLNTWMSICPKEKTESSYQQLKPKLWKQPRISNNLWALKSTPIIKIRIDLESVSNFAYAISWCSSKSKVWITLEYTSGWIFIWAVWQNLMNSCVLCTRYCSHVWSGSQVIIKDDDALTFHAMSLHSIHRI